MAEPADLSHAVKLACLLLETADEQHLAVRAALVLFRQRMRGRVVIACVIGDDIKHFALLSRWNDGHPSRFMTASDDRSDNWFSARLPPRYLASAKGITNAVARQSGWLRVSVPLPLVNAR